MMGVKAFSLAALLTAGCALTSAQTAGRANPAWVAWYGEYAQAGTAERIITIFENRYVESAAEAPLESREESDTAGYFRAQRYGDAYYLDELPIFLPTNIVRSIDGPYYRCSSSSSDTGFDVTCLSKRDARWLFKSHVEVGSGVAWFEFFCGRPPRTCRFEFTKGKKLLNPDQIKRIN